MSLYDWWAENTHETMVGPAQVGWCLAKQKAGVIYFEPERIRSVETNKIHHKSASRCPAVINMESRYFLIRCPFDIHLKFVRDKEGRASVRNMLGEKSPVRPSKLRELIHVTNEAEWRYPDRPTVQISLPYLFISDTPVYMTQCDASMHYRKQPLPGTLFGGRFPIHIWPRQLMWAFEWHDTEMDLILKRGDPWFYVMFEADRPDRAIQMVEAQMTPDFEQFIEYVSGAVNYVNQTFSLFEQAARARPKKLLTPVEREK